MTNHPIRILITALLSLALLTGCRQTPPEPPPTPAQTQIEALTQPEAMTETEPAAITEPSVETEPVIAQPEEEPPRPVTVSFVGGGDNIIYLGNLMDASLRTEPGGRTYNFKPAYEDIAPLIAEADISFINQETLMCGEGYAYSYYPRFNSPRDLGYDLAELGFDVVNIANNHMLDQGGAGLAATIDFWNSLPVTLIGGYTDREDFDRIRIVQRQGLKIAFLAFTQHTNFIPLEAGSPLVIPYIDEEIIARQIASARGQADLVIVSMHWGDAENVFAPDAGQLRTAQLIADCGADVILGHHPHVLQPIQWLTGAEGNRTLCVYSLGNLMAEMSRDYNLAGGLITFDITGIPGQGAAVENVRFLPTFFHYNSAFTYNYIYLYRNYTEELAASHGLSYYGRTTTLAALRKYVTDTISAEFLPEDF